MKRKHVLLLGGKFAVAAALLLLVYRHVSVEDVALDVQRLRVLPLVGFVSLLFANTFLSALKWKWLLAADGIRLSMAMLFGSYLIGTFFNLFLPSTVGGDTYRVASVGRNRVIKSTAAVLADRLSGFIALAAICTIFSVSIDQSVGHRAFFALPLLLLLALLGLALVLLWPASSRRFLTRMGLDRVPRLMSLAESFFLSFSSYRQHPTLIARVLGISFLFHFLVAVAIFCLSRALALHVPLVDFLAFVPIVTMVESIPISIYGVGLRDAGYVFFFTQIDLANAEAHALAMSILYLVTTAGYASLGGILLATRLLNAGRARGPAGRGSIALAKGGPVPMTAAQFRPHSVRGRVATPESTDPAEDVTAKR